MIVSPSSIPITRPSKVSGVATLLVCRLYGSEGGIVAGDDDEQASDKTHVSNKGRERVLVRVITIATPSQKILVLLSTLGFSGGFHQVAWFHGKSLLVKKQWSIFSIFRPVSVRGLKKRVTTH